MFSIKSVVIYLWVAAAAFWVIRAFGNKRTVRTQSARSRVVLMGAAIALALLAGFTDDLAPGLMDRPFVPDTPWVALFGFALVIAGMIFGIWARLAIGTNWSGFVTLKENHVLIRTGPYALVRHPIYSGIFLALFGTAIVFRIAYGLIITVLVIVMLILKSRIEEQLMLEQFGAQYEEYRRKVKAFIPFVY